MNKYCTKCGSFLTYDYGWTCETCMNEVVMIKRRMIEDGVERIIYLDRDKKEEEVGLYTVNSGKISRA